MVELVKKVFIYSNNNLLVQFFRYAIVGGLASVVDIGVFYIGANMLGIHHLIANTASFILGLLTNYFLSRRWVFNKEKHEFMKDFLLFAIIGVIGLALSNLILYVLIDCKVLYMVLAFIGDNMVKLSAKLIAVFLVLFWNFIARKKIVFDVYIRR